MYLDTSVIIKLFTREPESDYYAELIDGDFVSSSMLAYPEVMSALLAKERGKAISRAQRIRAWDAFERQMASDAIVLHPVSPAVFTRANRILVACYPQVALRSLDALHLAACDQAQDWPLVTSDHRMREAALLLNFPLSPLSA